MQAVVMQIGVPGISPLTLSGVFSKMELAQRAAEAWIKDHPGQGNIEWRREEQEHEVQYSNQTTLIVLDYWELDKALVDGQWIVLE